jgi:YidC/Oxa1 family membrane protein insertase
MQQQQRLILALVISAAVLFGWNYLFPPPQQTPPQQNKDINSASTQTPQPATNPSPSQPATISTQTPASASPGTPDQIPQRTLTISTPLYKAEIDSLGAIAKSWVILKNKETGRPLYSVAGNGRQQLELVWQDGLNRSPREAPLRLITEDANVNAALATRNYKISGIEGDSGNINLNLNPGESKRIDFSLHDDASNLDVTKSLTFSADSYSVDLAVNLKRADQFLPARLAVGPSIGDQGISHYSFYSVAPEGVASAGDQVHRVTAPEVHSDQEGWLFFTSKRPEGADVKKIGGAVGWAGIGDTYFAMVAVPSKPLDGLEYRTTKYEHEADGKKEDRFLITAYIPLPTDGSGTQLYTGAKDYYLLSSASAEINKSTGGRTINLEGLINYGFLETIKRPLAIPILKAIKFLSVLTGSYGVAIILFTIFIYSLFFPLKWQSSKKMKKAQKYAPRMKELQEKLKGMKQNDPRLKELQTEQLRLMKEANPLGGCLPLLIQMPFLFALYSAITISIDFRQASFLWIPDLSSAETTVIHILPILMAGSMMILQLITPAPSADPLQRKMMAVGMPIFMLYMFWSVPAGLVVYWLVGNIVGFAQQFIINRLTKSEDDEEPPGKKKAEPRPTNNSPNKLSTARAS